MEDYKLRVGAKERFETELADAERNGDSEEVIEELRLCISLLEMTGKAWGKKSGLRTETVGDVEGISIEGRIDRLVDELRAEHRSSASSEQEDEGAEEDDVKEGG